MSGEKPPSQPTIEQQVQAAYQQYQLLESQIGFYQEQFQTLSQLFTELSFTVSTLHGLKDASPDQEILIPIGSGVYAWGRIENKENILTLIGANIHVEKDIDAAIQIVQERRSKVESTLKKLTEETQKLAAERDQLRAFLEQYTMSSSQGQ